MLHSTTCSYSRWRWSWLLWECAWMIIHIWETLGIRWISSSWQLPSSTWRFQDKIFKHSKSSGCLEPSDLSGSWPIMLEWDSLSMLSLVQLEVFLMSCWLLVLSYWYSLFSSWIFTKENSSSAPLIHIFCTLRENVSLQEASGCFTIIILTMHWLHGLLFTLLQVLRVGLTSWSKQLNPWA